MLTNQCKMSTRTISHIKGISTCNGYSSVLNISTKLIVVPFVSCSSEWKKLIIEKKIICLGLDLPSCIQIFTEPK